MTGSSPTPRDSLGALLGQGRLSHALGAADPRARRAAAARTTPDFTGAFVKLDEQGRIALDIDAVTSHVASAVGTPEAAASVAAGAYMKIDQAGRVALDFDALFAQITASVTQLQQAFINSLVGVAFPTSTYDGKPFYNTTYGEQFHFNATHGLWMGNSTLEMVFCNQSTISAGGYFRPWQSKLPNATDEGLIMPWNGMIVHASFWKDDNTTAGGFDVKGDGVTAYSGSLAAASYTGSEEPNIALGLGEHITCLADASNPWTGGGFVHLLVRRSEAD